MHGLGRGDWILDKRAKEGSQDRGGEHLTLNTPQSLPKRQNLQGLGLSV